MNSVRTIVRSFEQMLQVDSNIDIGPARRLSMDPVSQHIRLEDLPNPGGRFELQDLLGSGTCSKTYCALDKQKGTKVAIKVISSVAESLLEIESEYRVLATLTGKSPMFPEFHGVYLHSDEDGKKEIWFVMELCQGVPVSDLLKFTKMAGYVLKEEEIAVLLKAFMMAILQLHDNDIIHRDIRASNFILSPEGNVKLIDFGTCALLKDTEGKAQSSVGAPYWMAPEVVVCEQMVPYSKSCDVWSLGITAIELADTVPPLFDIHPVRAMFQIARNPPPQLRKEVNWSENFKDFINECLVKNPEHRPCVVELLLHPFIAELEDNLKQKLTLEEHLQNPIGPTLGEKGNQILKNMGHMIEANLYPLQPYTPCSVTVKNGYLKKDCDSPYTRLLPDDLAAPENVSEDFVLDLLNHRYMAHSIYTYVGDILIGINPCKELPLYSHDVEECYLEKARSDNPPHIFAVADRAYQQMLHHKRSQVIILFGICASGKSYSANQLIRHLSFLGQSYRMRMSEKIINLCPLLDAFGSASTPNNPDSSRFLKTITVTFTKTGKITGGIISSMLLDVTRLVSTRNETNFHIFYYVYEGLKAENRLNEFGLDEVSTFRYLCHLGEKSVSDLIQGYKTVYQAFKILSFTDEKRNELSHFFYHVYEGLKAENRLHEFGLDEISTFRYLHHLGEKSISDLIQVYMTVYQAFEILPFTDEEIQTVLRCISAILLLGELAFTKNDSSVCVSNPRMVELVTKNLCVSQQEVEAMICQGNTVKEVEMNRDTFAQFLYLKIFDWVVSTMNKQLSFSRLVLGSSFSVSVIDPPGFENTGAENGLFHLSANTVGDYLQNYIQQLMFYKELEEYNEENVAIPFQYKESTPQTQLISTLLDNRGLFSEIDKASSSSSKENYSWEAFQAAVKDKTVEVQNDQITVNHLFDKVTYSTKALISQNLDCNRNNFLSVLKSSSHPIISSMGTKKARYVFSSNETLKPEEKGSPSQELKALLPTLLSLFTEDFPHLVVCIKPSPQALGIKFEQQYVSKQLSSFSLMEIILIRKQGFARRLTFAEFLNWYQYLAFDFDEEVELTMENCKLLLIRLKMNGWEMGKNKVFLKYYTEEYLSRLYETHVKKIVKVQAMARRFIVKVRCKRNV